MYPACSTLRIPQGRPSEQQHTRIAPELFSLVLPYYGDTVWELA